MLSVVSSLSVLLSAESVGDPEATRRVYVTIVILLVLGVSMLALAVWLFRRTRPEPELLAPLEVMDSRRWRRSEPAQRGRELDQKRPPGARPLRRAAGRPAVDSEFSELQPVRSFDDLAADAEPAARVDTSDSQREDVDPDEIDGDGPDPTPIGHNAVELPDDPTTERARPSVTEDAEGSDTDEPEPVMPGEGLLRRPRNSST